MHEYLTVEELSKRIRYAEQTIYNKISNGEFKLGDHYIKPSRKKVLFIWESIEKWLNRNCCLNDTYNIESAMVLPIGIQIDKSLSALSQLPKRNCGIKNHKNINLINI